MGQLTDSLRQLDRSIENETSKKITKKESKENYETYLFFEIWQTFARSQNIEKTYLIFKDTATTKKYIEEHQHIKEKNQDGYIKIIDFEALTITEKLTIYNKVLNNIYKQFQYKYKNLNYNTIPEEEKEKKKLKKDLEKKLFLIEQQKMQLEEAKTKYYYHKEQNKKETSKAHQKGFNKISTSVFIGSLIAGKKYKNKYKY